MTYFRLYTKFYNVDNILPGANVNVAPILGSILASMTNPVNNVMNETAQLAADLGTTVTNWNGLVELPQKNHQPTEVQPKSGINFVLYNNVFEVVEENTGYLPVDDRINSIQILATDLMVMKEAGFLEIFVNNQAQTPVYYDNFTVTTRGGVNDVIEVNAYYPFGMLMPGLGVIASKDKYNGYKHSAKELQREMELQWYDHGARMLGATVSRWWTPDPLAESFYAWSPYNYALNNPIRFIDPDGRGPFDNLIKGLKRLTEQLKNSFSINIDVSSTESIKDSKQKMQENAKTIEKATDIIGKYADGISTVNPLGSTVKTAVNASNDIEVSGEDVACSAMEIMLPVAGEIKAAKGGVNLLKAANALGKGGFTEVGRALQKHGSRLGSLFPKATGNAASINAQGEAVLKNIINHPNATTVTRHHARFGDIMEIKIPNGQGARFSVDGKTFYEFIE